jgi:hypothetical protein
MAGMCITKVIREHVELTSNPNGPSLGELIDAQIELKLSAGEFIREVTVEFGDEEWGNILRAHHEANRSKAEPYSKKAR